MERRHAYATDIKTKANKKEIFLILLILIMAL